MHARSSRPGGETTTRRHLDTPFKKHDELELLEVEITDCTHPLFGRRYTVASAGGPFASAGILRVFYSDFIVLKIPLAATNLAPPRPGLSSKLTADAISDLIALAEDSEVLCQSRRANSGRTSRQRSVPKSPTTSRPSSRR
jgi:hypothetical protein